MSIPNCGPEPEYYHTTSIGRSVSSEWWTWRMCQDEVANQSTISKFAPVGGDPATESDKSFTTTAFDTNFLADNFAILSVIVILAIATVILSVYLYRSRNVPVHQSEYDDSTVDLGYPTVRNTRRFTR